MLISAQKQGYSVQYQRNTRERQARTVPGEVQDAVVAAATLGGGPLQQSPTHMQSHGRNRHILIYADASCQLRGSKCADFTLGSQMYSRGFSFH